MTVHPTVDDLAQLCAAMARRCAGDHGGDRHRRPDADRNGLAADHSAAGPRATQAAGACSRIGAIRQAAAALGSTTADPARVPVNALLTGAGGGSVTSTSLSKSSPPPLSPSIGVVRDRDAGR